MTVRQNSRPHVCLVVQNLPVPFDRRVWLECQALRDAGYEVSVVCPKGPGDPDYQVLDAVHLYKYKPYPPTNRQIGFVGEYMWSIAATNAGLRRAAKRLPLDVIQLCNPPDVLWAAAAPFKARGVRMVFDQHDLCPELYESRFPDGAKLIHKALLATERITYRLADRVVSTNESYRRIACTRGRKHPDHVRVVRTGPDPNRMRRVERDPAALHGHKHLLTYIGVMGPQDGVDIALHAMHHIVTELKRTDIALTLMGDGDDGPALRRLCTELDLGEHVRFLGRVPDSEVSRIMSSADIGLCPDPRNPLNDVSTMNKTMEYMAYGLPVVAFDLVETKVSAGEAALYARPNSPADFAARIVELLDDEPRRMRMGAFGRERVEQVLAWRCQVPGYVALYDELMQRQVATRPVADQAAPVLAGRA